VNNEDLTRFLHLSGKLKDLKRTGWVEAGIRDPESVADHVFRVTLFSMILSDDKILDTLKVIRMALIHDLPESLIGDLTPKQKTSSHINNENDAMNQVLRLLPEQPKKSYHTIWEEYIRNNTPESRIVHEADKLEMLLQAAEYEARGEPGKKLELFWKTEISPEYKELVRAFRRFKII
jgi:putative hydrolase of HD superfamily